MTAAVIDAFRAFRFLAPEYADELAARLELCGIHACDVEICFDDANPECVNWRAWLEGTRPAL